MHAITKQLEICIDINIEISISFLQKAYELLSQSKKLNKRRVYKESDRVGEFFEKKNKRGEGCLLGTQEYLLAWQLLNSLLHITPLLPIKLIIEQVVFLWVALM